MEVAGITGMDERTVRGFPAPTTGIVNGKPCMSSSIHVCLSSVFVVKELFNHAGCIQCDPHTFRDGFGDSFVLCSCL